MALLKIHLGLIGITVSCMAVSVIHHNLIITPTFESEGKEIPSLPNPLLSMDTQPQKIAETKYIMQPENPVCDELKQMVTDASLNAANLSYKELCKILHYGNCLLN